MNSLKIGISPSLFADTDDTPLKVLKDTGVEIIENPYKRRLSEEEAIIFLKDLDGLIAGLEPLNKNVLLTAHRLKAIARVGIGTDNVDLAYAKEKGIKISNTPDGPTEAVAEMTLSVLLTINRMLVFSNNLMHHGEWKKTIGTSIKGQKILLIGYGRIGSTVSELLTKFGADVYVFDPFIKKSQQIFKEKLVSLEEGLKLADVISLHASGRDLILGQKEFGLMKEGVILLNSARGELVDEFALLDAIQKGKIGSVWFDVFWKEPYTGELTKYENVILTPHIGTYTKQCRLSMEMEAVNNILHDLDLK